MTHLTPKHAHAEAIRFLEIALRAVDEAHSCLRAANMVNSVETGSGPYRITARSLTGTLEELLTAAREAACEDCDALIAECQCAWSNRVRKEGK